MEKEFYLDPNKVVQHFDITEFDARPLLAQFKYMSFEARNLYRLAEIYNKMLAEEKCTRILAVAGSAPAAGCIDIIRDSIKFGLVDVFVGTGAVLVDMLFNESLGAKHYQGSKFADDKELRKLGIDRIYDTYISEDELRVCDNTIKIICDQIMVETGKNVFAPHEFLNYMGKYLKENNLGEDTAIRLAYEKNIPLFCGAFSDCSAGFGFALQKFLNPGKGIMIDTAQEFLDLTKCCLKGTLAGGPSGLFMIGGGVPKNFSQDVVVCAEMLGYDMPMHKYTIQITVADERDGALSGSTLKEAGSWGKVDPENEQMVFCEATIGWPIATSYVYHTNPHRRLPAKDLAKWIREDGQLPAPEKQ
jgi:deoxyhypusine synthase